ncbi:hypothetical protein, partial [Escherichia coli]|uniref:hypothetical protein n=1 Tax=Escherichia coli TaxID=562 RepID=UPI001920BBBE
MPPSVAASHDTRASMSRLRERATTSVWFARGNSRIEQHACRARQAPDEARRIGAKGLARGVGT